MKMKQLSACIALALLSGCYTLKEKALPELRAKVVLPLCVQDCNVEVNTSETPPPPRDAGDDGDDGTE